MIQIQNISKSFGAQLLFKEASFLVSSKERIGLIGRNGSGKSTLFKLILEQEDLEAGSIQIPKRYSLGYLSQHLEFSKETVQEEVHSVLACNEEGWIETHKAESILFGLGFTEVELQKDPNLLSGGFQIRLNLAKVLASEPQMLLLDEPTNYLDVVSTRWLAYFLRQWKGELLLITHDRSFMDSVCTHTVAIYQQKFRKIKGGVQKLKEILAEEEELAKRSLENDEKKREQLEKVVEKFRYKASKAAMVQSKIKAMDKLSKVVYVEEEKQIDFLFNEAEFPGKRMLQAKNVSFAYPNGDYLIEELSLEILKGDRLAIIGPNGRGKTTLLNLIAKELEASQGELSFSPNLKVNYFGQTNINRLDLENTVEEEIQTAVTDSSKGRARSLAGLMMFSQDAALKKISMLSGGERSRVLLAKILANPCNLLLLDEPTNHLDMESIQSLIEALDAYRGAAVVVTHDEDLLHAFAKKLIVFDGGNCFVYEGTYQEFLENIGWSFEKEKQEVKTTSSKDKSSRQKRAEYVAERSKILRPLQKSVKDLEDAAHQQEIEVSKIEEALVLAAENENGSEINTLSLALSEANKKLDHLYESWEEASHLLEEAEQKYQLD